MNSPILAAPKLPNSRGNLLDAAVQVIRTKGYAATTVDDICLYAGVTKGSFFHHFKSKDDLALAAVGHWKAITEGLFASAYHQPADPVARLLGYLDFRAAILTGEPPDYTCLLGTLVQETYDTHPHIRAVCEQALASHVAVLARDIEAAKLLYAPNASWTSESVGNLIQSVLQGSFIFAKAKQSPQIIRESLEHLRRYLGVLFSAPATDHQDEPITEENEEQADHGRDQSHYVD
jgi:TetR/AcrR family transcriptional regulator, transcriptional repressor for nem operon